MMKKTWSSKITAYFAKSLADADRVIPDSREVERVIARAVSQPGEPSESTSKALSKENWDSGFLRVGLVSKPTEILIFPRVDTLVSKDAGSQKNLAKLLIPVAIMATLDEYGKLKPVLGVAPWIPRNHIAPNNSDSFVLATQKQIDDFFSLNSFEAVATWDDMKDYCYRLVKWVSKDEGLDNQNSTNLYDLALSNDYINQAVGIFTTDVMPHAAKKPLIKVLEKLKEEENDIPLYLNFINKDDAPLLDYKEISFDRSASKKHVGQMSGGFALSSKQRNALHYQISMQNGEMLAVNGPPGTGKTTLLRSVIANGWTQAAVDRKAPPIVFAASSNNQAVLNVIECMGNANEEGIPDAIKGRWIPDVTSYGLYFCSSERANSSDNYQFYSPDGSGVMKAWQDLDFLTPARARFLEKVSFWAGKTVHTPENAADLIHEQLSKTVQLMQSKLDTVFDYLDYIKELNSLGGMNSIKGKSLEHSGKVSELEKKVAHLNRVLDKFIQHKEHRGLMKKAFDWVPSIEKMICDGNQKFLRAEALRLDGGVYGDLQVNAFLENSITNATKDLDAAKKAKARNDDLFYKLKGLRDQVAEYFPGADKLNSSLDLLSHCFSILDMNDRLVAFKLATHYWEAMWISEVSEFLDKQKEDKKTPDKIKSKLLRFAKLTPCFVGTLFMLPPAMLAGQFRDKVWEDIPLFSFIDLLTIDEAGQVLPDVVAPSMSLAKKALIVGDVDQIEPVWTLPSAIDRNNLKTHEIFGGEETYSNFWIDSGLLASSGCLMSVAHRQSKYHQLQQLRRGLYLTEHRRCFDPIISFCNEIVYKGALEPKRGLPASGNASWAMMEFVPVDGASKKESGSRLNLHEARAIVSWILAHAEEIQTTYESLSSMERGLGTSEIISKELAVITPFRAQANLIESLLAKEGLKGVTVGTVHALQGAERSLILFSPVYGKDDKAGTKFYDIAPNMLNVAVSRAKDAFIVFGHPQIFGVDQPNTYSARLRKNLYTRESSYKAEFGSLVRNTI